MASRPELCVGAVAVAGGALLMVRRRGEPGAGRWSLPGGRVEAGETVAEAVVRELAEETGVEAVCGPLLGWVERIGGAHHYVILDFAVTVLDPAEARPGSDASEVAWVALDDVWDLDLVEGLGEFLTEHGIVRAVGGTADEEG